MTPYEQHLADDRERTQREYQERSNARAHVAAAGLLRAGHGSSYSVPRAPQTSSALFLASEFAEECSMPFAQLAKSLEREARRAEQREAAEVQP